ncbi:MAG: hypothetical protein RLP14_05860 [Owenweeksia sp.]
MQNIRPYTLTIRNTHATESRTFILGRGLKEETGIVTDGDFQAKEDGEGTTSLTGTGSPGQIEHFLNFIARNPVSVRKMKFKSNSNEQTEVILNLRRDSPFRNLGDENIALSQFTDEYTQKDNVVTVRRNLQLDDQTKVEIPVVPGSTLTLTMEVEGIFNVAAVAAKEFERQKK